MKPYVRWAVTLAYAAGLFYLSSRPWSGVPTIPYIDKIAHLGLYAGLGFLCLWSLQGTLATSRNHLFFIAMAAVIAYGLSDEMHQMFVPGRSAEFGDLIADALGGALGVFLALWATGRSGAADEGSVDRS